MLLALVAALALAAAAPADDKNSRIVVNETPLDSTVVDMQWAGKDDQVVFIKTGKRSLYRSFDEGQTFHLESSKLGDVALESPPNFQSGVRAIVPNPIHDDKLFFLGMFTTHWRTFDRGSSYTTLRGQPRLTRMVFHPTKEEWALGVETSDPLCDGFHEDALDCNSVLLLTQDFGSTWERINSYVRPTEFHWGNAGLGDIHEETIYMVSAATKSGKQTVHWTDDFNFEVIDSFKKPKPKTLIPRGQAAAFMGDYIFVATLSEDNAFEVTLMVSLRGSDFYPARLPVELKQSSYIVLDTDLGSVFLHVNHEGFGAQWGNLYVSDERGSNYVMSLPFNYRNEYGFCDFDKMQGIDGIYVANEVTNAETMGDDDGAAIETRITLDSGGEWETLSPPRTDSEGNPTCKGCHLHLHGIVSTYSSFSQFPPFYSVPTAIGLMMATGNVGDQLTSRADETNTYFSADAGLTWTEVIKKPHVYEFGDHGGIMIMASTYASTDKVLYSWNHGASWTEYQFTDEPMVVMNIILEPSAISTKFMIYGARGSSGILVHIDFSSLHERQCVGASEAGSPDSDYELWSPRDTADSPDCLLGRKVQYTRRKGDAECLNSKMYEMMQFVNNCTCRESDFECDFGYARDPVTNQCKLVIDKKELPNPKDACKHGEQFYYVSKGYRKVPGDSCHGGDEGRWAPQKLPCSPDGMSGGSIAGIVIGILLFLACAVGGFAYVKNDVFRAMVDEQIATLAQLAVMPRSASSTGYKKVSTNETFELMGDDEAAADDDDNASLGLGLEANVGGTEFDEAAEEEAEELQEDSMMDFLGGATTAAAPAQPVLPQEPVPALAAPPGDKTDA